MDDDPAVSKRLEHFLQHFGYTVNQHASTRALLDAINDADYSVVLADHECSANGTRQLQAELASGNLTCPVIFMAENACVKTTVAALKDGAADFLEKPLDNSRLLHSLREAFSQADRLHQCQESRNQVQVRFQTLTPREQEIMGHIVTGISNRALSAQLGISVRTIEVHRSRVMKKMQADSLPDLVRLADLLDGNT